MGSDPHLSAIAGVKIHNGIRTQAVIVVRQFVGDVLQGFNHSSPLTHHKNDRATQ
jgi:ribosomal protein S19